MNDIRGRYDIKPNVCKQKEHNKVYLMEHNNVWWCTICKTICYGNGRKIIPCSYVYYKNWMIKLNLPFYTESEIEKWQVQRAKIL